ncbi:hypothetical protein QTP70_024363 [Hemibagrus guttatus]|uniref:TNF family profile domain-containing protein n=1 Tax=Hemibagrus guttatus TaxID=175788 RepID=A0AAE0PZY8_9TELE|nr:hypothetical protein QTP70_024363 [Hemibagrus guttatus]KAK3530599.1 hypothetical protein QTP86_028826 [Hemibagrus guttatus]
MDVFLLCSVITLFVLVLSGTALGFWIVQDLRAEMERHHPPNDGSMSARISEIPPKLDSSYKVQDFAYLTATDNELKNASMEWAPILYRNGSTVGSSYSYDAKNAVLKVNKEATYFLYTQLNLTCVQRCGEGTLSITFMGDMNNELMTCSLHLQMNHSQHVVKKCWTVIPHLSKGSQLMARMHGSVKPDGWKLEHNYSGFGMFMVD